jgi:hypothetical protein
VFWVEVFSHETVLYVTAGRLDASHFLFCLLCFTALTCHWRHYTSSHQQQYSQVLITTLLTYLSAAMGNEFAVGNQLLAIDSST